MATDNHGHHHHHPPSERRYLEYVIFTFAGVLVVLVVVLALDYRSLRRATTINARESWVAAFIQEHGPVNASDVTLMRSWMTFDYLNKLFKLPPNYLQSALGIADPRYPRLTVSGWAKGAKLDSTTAMSRLQDVVRNYLMQTNPTSTTSTAT